MMIKRSVGVSDTQVNQKNYYNLNFKYILKDTFCIYMVISLEFKKSYESFFGNEFIHPFI